MIAKLVNLESNNNFSVSQGNHSLLNDGPYQDQNEVSDKSLEESLLFEDFSSSDDSSEGSRKLE